MNVSAALRNNALKKLGSRWSGKIPETEAEARKAYLPYKIVTYVGMVGMTFFYFYLTSHPHHVEDKKVPYPYLKVMNKQFPWGDGETPLVWTIFGKPHHQLEDDHKH